MGKFASRIDLHFPIGLMLRLFSGFLCAMCAARVQARRCEPQHCYAGEDQCDDAHVLSTHDNLASKLETSRADRIWSEFFRCEPDSMKKDTKKI